MGTGMARSAWTSARGGARSLAGFLQVPKSETHRALVTREFVFRNKRWSQGISWTSLEFGVESSKAHCPWHGRAPRPPRLLLRGPLLRRHVFGSTPQCGGTGSKGTWSDADRWSPMPHPPAQDGERDPRLQADAAVSTPCPSPVRACHTAGCWDQPCCSPCWAPCPGVCAPPHPAPSAQDGSALCCSGVGRALPPRRGNPVTTPARAPAHSPKRACE